MVQSGKRAPTLHRFLLLTLFAVSSSASAIVIRDDVEDSRYRVPASGYPAFVDLPGEGHGVLIDPQWVVTAAHAVAWQPGVGQVTINGIPRDVERVVMHPGHWQPSQALLDQALATWDWTLFRVLLASSDDIALLKLSQPVTDVAPVAIYKGDNEFGQVIEVVGKGATGNGLTGYEFDDSHRTELRRAQNKAHQRRWPLAVLHLRQTGGCPAPGGWVGKRRQRRTRSCPGRERLAVGRVDLLVRPPERCPDPRAVWSNQLQCPPGPLRRLD